MKSLVRVENFDTVRVLTLNRPEALNALNAALKDELLSRWRQAIDDDSVRSIVLTGEGRAFCAGGDIKERANSSKEASSHLVRQAMSRSFFDELAASPKFWVCAVNGMCLGGGLELALGADALVCSSEAQFGLPEVKLGIIPQGGGTQRLARATSPSFAKWAVVSGENFDAATAVRVGLATSVEPQATLMERALAIAQVVASRPPLAVKLAREVVDAGYALPLADGLRLELLAGAVLAATADHQEGLDAFVEKRAPQFRGR